MSRQSIQEVILNDAKKGEMIEQKLRLPLGGYQQRAKTLRRKIVEASDALEKATVSLDSFRSLQISEEAAITRRLEQLRSEVEFVSRREREAQELYRTRKEELDSLVINGYH